jgi:hypothetical protein
VRRAKTSAAVLRGKCAIRRIIPRATGPALQLTACDYDLGRLTGGTIRFARYAVTSFP